MNGKPGCTTLLWTFHDGEHERKYVAVHGITKAINLTYLASVDCSTSYCIFPLSPTVLSLIDSLPFLSVYLLMFTGFVPRG